MRRLLLAAFAIPAFAQNAALIDAGRQTFLGACSACHGANGQGGTGPNLTRQTRRLNEEQLSKVVRDGVPGTDMPPFPMADSKIRELTAFVRSLNAPAIRTRAEGNVEAGSALFFGKAGCSGCHQIGGRGGFIGPDLSNAGTGATLLQLRESIFDPNARIERGFEAVTVTRTDGTTIEGVAKNHNNYSTQVLDRNGRLHLLTAAQIRQIQRREGSLMPAGYDQKLSKPEAADIIAFLSRQSIRGGRAQAAPAVTGSPTFDEIAGSPNRNWLTYNGDFAGRRFSPLTQITPANSANMTAKWVYNFPGARRLSMVPLVYEGIMYVTNTNEVHALDARTGRRIWEYKSESLTNSRVNRGVAILGDRVFLATNDAHLVAIHRITGGVIWDRQYADATKGYFSTVAPLVIKGGVLVGVGGGGSGQRGFVASLSPDDGRELWRFWTVPAKGEPGSETWGGFPAEFGGAPTWTTGTYDAKDNIVYWPTGNPWPDFYGGRRKGDNLYSDSLVALDGATGKLKWHFQYVPHDVWDWDANETPVLLDIKWKGQDRKVVVMANRNGFYYVHDRITGEYLHAQPFVRKLDWATGLDPKGRPILAPNKIPTPAGVKVCPSVRGATNWMSPSFNPVTGMLYVVTLEQCDIYIASAKEPVPASGFRGTGGEGIPTEPGEFSLRALDAATGEIRWSTPMPGPAKMWAGTVATASGVVFSGDDDGHLVAFDAKTGKDLWHFGTGHTLYASPITFELDGKQYVTIAAETDIYTFGLP